MRLTAALAMVIGANAVLVRFARESGNDGGLILSVFSIAIEVIALAVAAVLSVVRVS